MAAETLAMRRVLLYVFSGVHQGARIELPVGLFLLGSSDECDLILTGLAPKHAKLSIEVDGNDQPKVSLEPVEGQVTYEKETLAANTDILSGVAFFLDRVCFAWNLPGVEQAEPVFEDEYTSRANPETNQKAASDTVETNQKAPSGNAASEANANLNAAQGASNEPSQPDPNLSTDSDSAPLSLDAPAKPKPFFKRISKFWSLIILALLLGGLSFSLAPNEPKEAEYPAIVENLLKEQGLRGLLVSNRANGVEVRGALATSTELAKLKDTVQDLFFPVYLEVAVDQDLENAVRNSLGVRGFYPLVSIKRNSGVPKLLISAFMRDTLVETDAFAYLERDVPSPPIKERRIVYEQDVAAYVLSALSMAGFSGVQPVYLPGRISLQGSIGSRIAELARLKAKLSAHFGVPLFGEGTIDKRITSPQTSQRLAVTPDVPAAEPNSTAQNLGDVLGGLKITGVFVAPLKFITTDNGGRFFPGSVLPNGAVLEDIGTAKLTLRIGSEVKTYTFRGVND